MGVVVLVLALAVTAYYPFEWNPPRTVTNEVTRTSDGALTFGATNRARSAGDPGWLATAEATGALTIALQVRPADTITQGARSIMMLSQDYWHCDFSVAQAGPDLVLWLRRAGSNANGEPVLAVPKVFTSGRWTAVELRIRDDRLQVDVDGTTRLSEPVGPRPLASWEPGRVALGGELNGGAGWSGQVRSARVTGGGQTVDYTSPGALDVPPRFFLLPDHLAPFPPYDATEWVILVLHLVTFVPVGMLLAWSRRPPLGVRTVVLAATAIALALAAGKFLFDDRHAAVADVVVQAVGAAAGAMLARLTSRRLAAMRAGRGQEPAGAAT